MEDRIRVEQSLLWSGTGKYKLANWASLIEAPNGDLLCGWMSGGDNEPATDNTALLARSQDGGRSWSKPELFGDPHARMQALACWHQTADGRIVAIGVDYPDDHSLQQYYCYRTVSHDSGYTWSRRERVATQGNTRQFVADPITLDNGEHLWPVGFTEKRTQPLVGPLQKTCLATNEAEALAIPAEEGTYCGHSYASHLHGCSVFIGPDDSATNLTEYGYITNRPLGLDEPACIQLGDNRIVMLMRAEWAGVLWRAESTDNGRTWSEAQPTDIPNPNAKISLSCLADGRIALLHNPNGMTGVFTHRNPLSIWVSDDEMESWCIKEDLIATSGSYRPDNWDVNYDGPAYPKGEQDQLAYPDPIGLDGRLVFVYDRNRRDVMFVAVEID